MRRGLLQICPDTEERLPALPTPVRSHVALVKMRLALCDDAFRQLKRIFLPGRGAPSVYRLMDRRNHLLRRGHGIQNYLRVLPFGEDENNHCSKN